MSMIPAARTPVTAKPSSGLIPIRYEPDPPVTLMSASSSTIGSGADMAPTLAARAK